VGGWFAYFDPADEHFFLCLLCTHFFFFFVVSHKEAFFFYAMSCRGSRCFIEPPRQKYNKIGSTRTFFLLNISHPTLHHIPHLIIFPKYTWTFPPSARGESGYTTQETAQKYPRKLTTLTARLSVCIDFILFPPTTHVQNKQKCSF